MKRILLLNLVFLLVAGASLQAQDRTVSGKITDDNGEALPGVNVILKGTTSGTTSDLDGNYRISVPSDGGTLVLSFIGYATQEVEIGARSVVDITLSTDVQELTEVVVTAQGIEQDRKSLGYAVSTVDGRQLQDQPSGDVGRILQSKVPGMNVTASNGVSGTGTNIIIRGYSSITGTNQPLFIVDGVPFNSSTNTDNSGGDFQQGQLGTSSRFLDLDPNNIESVNVLKGLSATVIYGEQGRNGVILITTKNGRGGTSKEKLEVTLNQSYFITEIASLPDYQNSYGGGFHQNFGFFFSNWGPSFDTRGQRGIDENGQTDHPYSRLTDETLRNQFPEFLDARYDYRAYDDPGEFFDNGSVINTSVNIKGVAENTNYGATLSYTRDIGFTPNNKLRKVNFGIGGNTRLSNKITLNSTFNVAITDMQTPPISASFGSSAIGQGESIFGDVFYTPRNVDLNNLPFVAPADGRPVYYRSGNDITNPNWTANFSRQTDDVVRFYGKTSIIYDIAEWLNVQYRVGLDTYSERLEWFINKGSNTTAAVTPGVFRTNDIVNTIWNQDLIFTINKRINQDIGLQANLGINDRRDRFERRGIESVNQLVFGFIEHSNFTDFSPINSFSGIDIQNLTEERLQAIYGQVTLDYRGYLFLNIAGRNDWSSTVEKENRSLFYPSVSVSFVPSEVFDITSDYLNYLKFRIGFGQSAGFPPPYATRNVLNSNSRAFVTRNGSVISTNSNATNFGTNDGGAGAALGNPNLLPERHKEWEVGIESKLIKNRVSLNATLYRKITNDLITSQPIDPATGFTSTAINIGEIENKGVEIDISATPLKIGDFQWDISGNFFAYETTVNELTQGLTEVTVAGFTNIGNFAIVDEPFNVIQGSTILRDSVSGQPIIGGNGLYQQDPNLGIIGDPNPDFTTSIINTFKWKGLTFSAQLDYRKGGDIYSITANTLIGRGISEDTDFDRTQNYVLKGVNADGETNRQIITTTNLGFDGFITSPDEQFIYDGTTIRLRNISLGYNLPTSLLANTPFGEVSITLSAQNLWFNAVNFPDGINFDTDVTSLNAGGNGLGFDFLTGPSAKRYGAALRVKF